MDVGSGLKGRLSTETPGKTPEPACGLLEEEEDAQHPILSSKINMYIYIYKCNYKTNCVMERS